MTRRFLRDRSGVSAVEFAFVAPIVIALVFGIFQVGITVQQWNALQSVSDSTARCYAIASTSCAQVADAKTYALTTASARGVPNLTTSMVAVATSDAKGVQTADVTINYPVNIAGFTANLSASASFPMP